MTYKIIVELNDDATPADFIMVFNAIMKAMAKLDKDVVKRIGEDE